MAPSVAGIPFSQSIIIFSDCFLMTITALALILAAAFIHAYWNFLSKRASGGVIFVWLFTACGVVLYLPVLAILLYLDPPHYGLFEWSLIAASGVVHLAYSLVLQRGYQAADFSVVYPLARGSGPLMSSLGAILLFGERPTPIAALGILLIIGGIFMIAGGPGLWRKRDRRVLTGIWYGCLTGLFIACYTLVDGYAVKLAMIAPIFLEYFGMVIRLLLLTPSILKRKNSLRLEWRRQFGLAAAVGALFPLSYILFLYAMRLAPISYIAPARELSMLIGAFLGVKLLGEESAWQRVTGTIFLLGGIVGLMLA